MNNFYRVLLGPFESLDPVKPPREWVKGKLESERPQVTGAEKYMWSHHKLLQESPKAPYVEGN